MFGLFRKGGEKIVSDEQLRKQAVKELKKIRKVIRKRGGAVPICYEYWKFMERDETYNSVGYIFQADAPHEKLVVMFAALDLLHSWKTEEGLGDEHVHKEAIASIMEKMPERVYIAASASFDVDEAATILDGLRDVLAGAGGRNVADSELVKLIAERNSEAKLAWDKWKADEEFDVLEAIRIS